MSSIADTPAFPTNIGLGNHQAVGMTLRDYFAAKAMQAMMTAGYWNWKEPKEDSDRCYAQADAMLKARSE
jgi:hypothetical protein